MANSPLVGGFNSLFNSSTLSLSLVFLRNMLTIGDHHPKNLVEHETFSPTNNSAAWRHSVTEGASNDRWKDTFVPRIFLARPENRVHFIHDLVIVFLIKKTVLGFIHFYALFSDTSGSLFIDQILFDGQITTFQNFRWLGHVQLLFIQEFLIFWYCSCCNHNRSAHCFVGKCGIYPKHSMDIHSFSQ